jgi:hypothetical protein
MAIMFEKKPPKKQPDIPAVIILLVGMPRANLAFVIIIGGEDSLLLLLSAGWHQSRFVCGSYRPWNAEGPVSRG